MRFFWIINGKAIQQISLIVTAAFIAALIAFMHNEQMAVFSTTDEGPRAISKVDTEKKQLALTFDIHNGKSQVKPILKSLKKHHAQATFFITGSWAKKHPKIVKKISNKHHELASHGFTNRDYASLEPEKMKRNMQLSRKAIKKAGDQKPVLLRLPKDHFDQNVLKQAASANYTVIDWSVDAKDSTRTDAGTIVNNVVEQAARGDIIRMHADDAARQTPRALSAILDELQEEGYTFVTVSRLLTNAETESELIH